MLGLGLSFWASALFGRATAAGSTAGTPIGFLLVLTKAS